MRIYRHVVTSLIALGAVLAPRAQVAPATPAGAIKETEAVVLSPFEVNASADVGYQAGNTTSGSRLNAKLKDTAAPITPFTPEFLSDFALTNIEEIMSYSANFEKDLEDSNAGFNSPSSRTSAAATPPFRVRGLAAAFAVDLMESGVPQDNYNIDRVEVSSGPNSVLFGLGSAGGTVSLTSKQAGVNRAATNLKAVFGSWDFHRFEGDSNQVLVKDKLALRLNGLFAERGGWRYYDFEDTRRLAAAVTYKPRPATTLRAAWEGGEFSRHTDWAWPAADAVKLWLATGRPAKDGFTAATDNPLGITRIGTVPRWTFMDNNGTAINLQNELQSAATNPDVAGNYVLLTNDQVPAKYGFSGPGSKLTGTFHNYSARFEHRFGRNLTVEGAFLHTENDTHANGWAVPGNNITLRGDPNLTYANPAGAVVANPYSRQLYMENNWRPDSIRFRNDVLRLTGAYELDLGKWGRHRFAGLLESGKVESTTHTATEILVDQNGVPIVNATAPENAQNTVFRRHYVTEGDFSTYFQSTPEVALSPFQIGSRTFSSHYVALNANAPGHDFKQTDTMMLATQNYWLKERLITTLGYRRDRAVFKNGVTARLAASDPLVTSGQKIANEFAVVPGQYVKNTFEPDTFTAGAVVHASSRLSFFYNRSNNVGAPRLNSTILPGVLGPMTDGKSQDYGVMIDVLGDDRYFLRVTRFDSSFLHDTPVQPGTNGVQVGVNNTLDALVAAGRITTADAAPWRTSFNSFSIDVLSRGYEAEFIANPTRNLTFRASFSYSDRNRDNFFPEGEPYLTNFKAYIATVNTTGVITSAGNTIPQEIAGIDAFVADTAFNQLQPFSSRPYKLNMNSRYSFREGALKGLAIGGAVRFQSDNYMQKDTRAFLSDNITPNPNLNKEYYGNLFEAWDFFTSYRCKLPWAKTSLTLQVNVRNAFNQDKIQPAKFVNDFSGLRRVYLNEPRSWRFSASMDF